MSCRELAAILLHQPVDSLMKLNYAKYEPISLCYEVQTSLWLGGISSQRVTVVVEFVWSTCLLLKSPFIVF